MINIIEETSFGNAWWKAIRFVLQQKQELQFGTPCKHAWDSTQLIELSGNAVTQVLNGDIHPMSTFKAINSYKREFTYEYLEEYNKKQQHEKFDYLYMDRLANYAGLTDQIKYMLYQLKDAKKTDTSQNTTLATTWYADATTVKTKTLPCLQIIQLRYNPYDMVDIHLIWRSRDLYNAWQANIIALTDMINREILVPNECKIKRIVDYSTSSHIYYADIEQAKRVNMVWPR